MTYMAHGIGEKYPNVLLDARFPKIRRFPGLKPVNAATTELRRRCQKRKATFPRHNESKAAKKSTVLHRNETQPPRDTNLPEAAAKIV